MAICSSILLQLSQSLHLELLLHLIVQASKLLLEQQCRIC
jgi:hypothetical protein